MTQSDDTRPSESKPDETNPEDQSWLRVEILTRKADIEASRLVQLGALGVEVQDRDTYMDDAPFAPVPEGHSRLIAFFDNPSDGHSDSSPSLRVQLEESLRESEIIDISDYNDRSWETAWMKYFEPLQISPRVAVGPPWDPAKAPVDGISLTIEPGMAFGTGTHETTRLCLRLLDEILAKNPADSLLDVGCGSAILSMAASGLGVENVVGIDIDSTSIEVARVNIEKNGFSSGDIDLSTRPIHIIEETFDLVVANILAPILIDLSASLLDAVKPGGELLLSGIPDVQLDEVREVFSRPDFEEVSDAIDGEWTALHLHRTHGES